MPELQPPPPPKLVWPKYALAAVILFFTLCIVWTVKEVNRLKRAKQDGMETRPFIRNTN